MATGSENSSSAMEIRGQRTPLHEDSVISVAPAVPSSPARPRDIFHWELGAEAITLRIRWFGLLIGVLLAYTPGRTAQNFATLNAILLLGALYAIIDTYYRVKGRIFLGSWPLIISVMEALFIGLLCRFDEGLTSPFRFYYVLSLLVCAIRNPAWISYLTLTLHIASYIFLAANTQAVEGQQSAVIFLVVLLGWVTWATVSLADLTKKAGQQLVGLNEELRQNQSLLELRISERSRQLQESQAMLVQHEKQAAFGLLAAGIAHEVGNPLAAISSLVQLLNRRDIDQHTREKLQLVDDQLRRIQRTLRELVDFSRPASTQESMLDIHQTLGDALNIAKYYKRKKGKHIVTAFAPGIPVFRGIRDQLVQVFLNLILNALDATPEGATITLRTSIERGWLRIDVSDNGPGISPEHRNRIFQPYFTTKETGTGLGLFVCRNIIEHQHGGRIELTTSDLGGTTFTVFLSNEEIRRHADLPPGPANNLD